MKKNANGDKYEGQWKDGQANGLGTCVYANGDIYEGQFKDDKRHGQGTYKFIKRPEMKLVRHLNS